MGTQERKTRHKESLRREILDAARELFIREGYEHVSMRKIAERIEYSPGTLYLHFRDKADILSCLCEETFTRLHERLSAIVSDPGDPLGALRRSGRAYIEFGIQHPDHYLLTMVLSGRQADEPAMREMFFSTGMRCFNCLRALVGRCVEEGLMRVTDVEEASQVLWAGIHGVTTLLITKKGFPFVEQSRLVERTVDVLIEGVRKQ